MSTATDLLTSKIPPHSLEAERAVLGAIMLERESLPKAVELLRPQDFYKEGHRQIFATMVSLFERSDPVDLLTLTEELRRRGELDEIGGPAALAAMVEEAATAAHLEVYAKIVKDHARRRELVSLSTRLIQASYESRDDVDALLGWARDQLLALAPNGDGRSGPVLVRLSDVEPEAVNWLWPGRIARGKLTLLVGDPGLGKSFACFDLASRLTSGGSWPDRGLAQRERVILLTAEDGLADTVRPRIDALGGDPGLVSVLQAVRGRKGVERGFSLATDLAHLEAALAETQAALVIFDPLSAYLGPTDSYKDAEVRRLLAPLAALAERHRAAIVSVLHLSKDAQRRALYRAQGSIAFVAASRAVFAVAEDPETPGRRFLAPIKLNLAPLPPTLAFRITENRLEWEADPVDRDAETILGPPPSGEDRAQQWAAEEFLEALLQDGPVGAREILKAARLNGLSERTLDRAKAKLRIVSERIGGIAGSGGWFWRLPGASPKDANLPAKGAGPRDVAPLDELSDGKAEMTRASAKGANTGGVTPLDEALGTLSDWGQV